MRPTPPLPLVDGCFVADNSSLEKLKCPRLFENEVVRQRCLADNKAGRNFGACLHKGWAVRYANCLDKPITPAIVELQNEEMRQWLSENPQPPMNFRDLAHAQRVMKAYNAHYQQEPFKVLTAPGWEPGVLGQNLATGTKIRWKSGQPSIGMFELEVSNPTGMVLNPENIALKLEVFHPNRPLVERSFMLPIGEVDGTPCYYSGKIDLAIEDSHGIWAGPDHKSAYMFGESFDSQMAVDGGQLGYTWALWQVLGRRPRGYIVDAVRIRRPNKEQRMAMEYGSYETASAPVDANDFKRMPFDVTEETLSLWRENVLAQIKTIFFHARNNYYPMHRWNCTNKYGKCDMYEACHIPAARQEDVLYNSTRFEENTWKMGLNMPEV